MSEAEAPVNGRELELPSGAVLTVQEAPFADSKALYQAVASELIGIRMLGSDDFDVNLLKDVVMTSVCSKKIEAALDKCLARCLYNGEKITDRTWEPTEARGDYFITRYEVAYDNVHPFLKGPISKYSTQLEIAKSTLMSLFAKKTFSSTAGSSTTDSPNH